MNYLIYLIVFATVVLGASAGCKNKTDISPINRGDSTLPRVPSGFQLQIAAGPELVDYPMFCSLDPDGRLFVFESVGNVYDKTEDALKNPRFRIKLLVDTSGDGIYDKATIYADKLSFPQGGVFYNGSLYASSAPDLLKFTDINNDGIADKKEVILTGWTLNTNANSLVGPVMAPDGWLYMNSAIMGFDVTTREGKRLKGETSRTWRLKPDGSQLEWISAGGMNNPVELAFTEASEPIGTETYFTDPRAGERDALVYWTEGGVYPKPNSNIDRDSLPRTGELMPVVSKFSRVAPSGICRYRSAIFGEDYQNNFFSAQFNTHRVMRHIVSRNGGSFTSSDQVFLESDNEDFHPTDVLEDADGSLLVVETGGWFIQGCPLSQVSKPELKGAIYRVRKLAGDVNDDIYGTDINWKTLQSPRLVNLLEDKRPFVQDKSIEELVRRGNRVVEDISEYLSRTKTPAAKVRAIFVLYRIASSESMSVVSNYINDKNEEVSIAASRCAGLYRDKNAFAPLATALKTASSAAKRQAATALGQLANIDAVPLLLEAAKGEKDRFVEHAIIYSLISLNQPQLTSTGLESLNAETKKAALIALDQMKGTHLSAGDLAWFLNSGQEHLQKTALWIASRHPAWAAQMTDYIKDELNKKEVSEQQQKTLIDLMAAYAAHPDMQQFIAKSLRSSENKLMLMEVMLKTNTKSFPQKWKMELSHILTNFSDVAAQEKAIEIIRLHGLKGMQTNLLAIFRSERAPMSLRLDAFSAARAPKSPLSQEHFNMLIEQLSGTSATTRQQAAGIIGTSRLNVDQLTALSTKHLHNVDVHTLNILLPVFEGKHSAAIGISVAEMLASSPGLDGFTEERLRKLFADYPPSVKPSIDTLITALQKVRGKRLSYLNELGAGIDDGNLDHGRILFFGKATCGTCHTIGPDGGNLGPDLTSIQRDRSRHDLLEAIVYPSVSFVREFETYVVKTTSGSHAGVIKKRTPDFIELAVSSQSIIRIESREILSIELSDLSLMPQGFDKLLTRQELSDLMAFLLGQDQDPETDARILR